MMYLEDLATAVALTLFCGMILLAAAILEHPEWLEAAQ